MSIATDLRNLASRADKVQEAFTRLHFCATTHLIAMNGTDSREIQRTLEQLRDAVNATAATSCR